MENNQSNRVNRLQQLEKKMAGMLEKYHQYGLEGTQFWCTGVADHLEMASRSNALRRDDILRLEKRRRDETLQLLLDCPDPPPSRWREFPIPSDWELSLHESIATHKYPLVLLDQIPRLLRISRIENILQKWRASMVYLSPVEEQMKQTREGRERLESIMIYRRDIVLNLEEERCRELEQFLMDCTDPPPQNWSPSPLMDVYSLQQIQPERKVPNCAMNEACSPE